MLRTLTKTELQELTLMVGSRKGLQTYLGMERKEFENLWVKNTLMTPTDWLRTQTRDQISSRLIKEGSISGAAKYYGVSDSFLKSILGPGLNLIDEKPITMEALERYGSVRLTARMAGVSEGRVRAFVKANKLERLLKYDFSNHNNGKGRRAETYWASLEGDKVTEDLNVTRGSQADYDYEHTTLGKVNVKSSKAYRYTAKTRAKNPYYWKLSITGLDKADTCACVLLDSQFKNVLHVFNIPAAEVLKFGSGSVTLQVTKGGKGYEFKGSNTPNKG